MSRVEPEQFGWKKQISAFCPVSELEMLLELGLGQKTSSSCFRHESFEAFSFCFKSIQIEAEKNGVFSLEDVVLLINNTQKNSDCSATYDKFSYRFNVTFKRN